VGYEPIEDGIIDASTGQIENLLRI